MLMSVEDFVGKLRALIHLSYEVKLKQASSNDAPIYVRKFLLFYVHVLSGRSFVLVPNF